MIRVTRGRIQEVANGRESWVRGKKRRIILTTCLKCGNRYPEGTECLICKKKELAN